MQNNYNLLARKEEREMLPLCADQGLQTIVHSPLARGGLAKPWGEVTVRTETEAAGAAQNAATAVSDRQIVDALSAGAAARGITQAQLALA